MNATIDILFNAYMEQNEEMHSSLDDDLQKLFDEVDSHIADNTIDSQHIADLELAALQAGFLAGFTAMRKLFLI